MDKRYLESPAHRQYIITAIRNQVAVLQGIEQQLAEKDIDVTTAMIDVINAQQAFQKELLVKLLSP